ncbi:MAG TPA: Crp/Fnr family transcriptional regulator [Trueperaceae bacterium]
MRLDNAQVLARCPLFAQLPDEDIEALAAIATRLRLEKGQSIFMAGEPAEALRVVVTGSLKVFVISPQSGRELVLTVERPFSSVAELPSFDEGVYPASAEALEECELLVLPDAALKQVLRERPDVALHLLRTLGRRLRRLVELVEQLSFQEVVQRLAGHLLDRAAAGLPFELETNGEIAGRLGTVPELVSRNLSRLQNSGMVTMQRRTVTGIDDAGLRAMADSAGR